MTVALIDADIVAYRCAASAEKDTKEIACIRATRLLQDILNDTCADEVKLFLSGSSNFRYDIFPDYKANRRDMKRPQWLQGVREFLVLKWGAEVTDGYEADDALGIESGDGRIVCSLDKDLLQLAGSHFNFVTGAFQTISETDGWRNFYSQLVLGDKADNIPGFDGKSRVKWPKFLMETRVSIEKAKDQYDMYQVARTLYGSVNEEVLIRNARLLYVWRKQNDQYKVPTKVETTSEAKQEIREKSESIVTMPVENTPSMELTSTKQNKGGFPRRGRSKATSTVKKSRRV